MQTGNTYVYFAVKGEDFNPEIVTQRIGIVPTEKWKVGEKGKYKHHLSYSCWLLSTNKSKENIFIDSLLNELVEQLFDKIEIINELKEQFTLESVLEIVMYIDTNEEQPTPALGHDLKTIEFLDRTKTVTDVDIYRFNSANTKTNNKPL